MLYFKAPERTPCFNVILFVLINFVCFYSVTPAGHPPVSPKLTQSKASRDGSPFKSATTMQFETATGMDRIKGHLCTSSDDLPIATFVILSGMWTNHDFAVDLGLSSRLHFVLKDRRRNAALCATFVGNVIASFLYGVASIQAYNYFRRKHNDSIIFRLLLFLVWLADTTQLVFVTHALYHYMVINYDNPIALLYPNWSILVISTCISGFIVRGVFTRRVWLITGRNYLLAGVIGLASLATFVFGFAFAISGFSVGTFVNLQSISFLLYSAFASAVAADVLIATSLCVSLSRRRTGFKRTDSLLNLLILYAINSSLLTSLCSIGSLVTYAVWPTQFTFIAVFFSQSKLYSISLFASVNSREHLREKIVASKDIPLSLPGRPVQYSVTHEQDDHLKTTQSVMVTIERKVETDSRNEP